MALLHGVAIAKRCSAICACFWVTAVHSEKPGSHTCQRFMLLCSMFVLDSCEGFEHDSFHVYCCLQRSCLTYTQAAYASLGNALEGELDLLSCHARTVNAAPEPGSGAVAPISDARCQLAARSLVSLSCAVAALLIVMDVFW